MRAVADRGLQAYAVPSARAGQQTDPAARRDALSGLMTGGFLVAVIAAILAIVIAAPQYAEPAAGALVAPAASGEPAPDASGEPVVTQPEVMTSDPPDKLKGYRWPVRGGSVDTYYGRNAAGRFEIAGERVHDGLVITWFEGAQVKAAHKGTVVAAGRGWIHDVGYIGYDGQLDEALELFERRATRRAKKTGKDRERYPQGIVIDDGNGYYSVYTELKNLSVKVDDEIKAGQTIGQMARLVEGKQMMRYRLVRMDGPPMKVHQSDRDLAYPDYARERVDPLAVLKIDAKHMPKLKGKRPTDPPHLSDY